jgi:hypothetical protein
MYRTCRPIIYKHNTTGSPMNMLAMLPFHFFTLIFPDDSFHSILCIFAFSLWCRDQMRALATSLLRFLDHTMTHNSRYDSSGRPIRHPCTQPDSSPRSQQASGPRPMLRPSGHWLWPSEYYPVNMLKHKILIKLFVLNCDLCAVYMVTWC